MQYSNYHRTSAEIASIVIKIRVRIRVRARGGIASCAWRLPPGTVEEDEYPRTEAGVSGLTVQPNIVAEKTCVEPLPGRSAACQVPRPLLSMSATPYPALVGPTQGAASSRGHPGTKNYCS